MLNLMGVADPDGEGMITRERLKRVAQWLTVRLTVALRRKAALPPGSLPAVPCRAVPCRSERGHAVRFGRHCWGTCSGCVFDRSPTVRLSVGQVRLVYRSSSGPTRYER